MMLVKRTGILLIIFFALIINVSAQEKNTYSLRECVETGINNNLRVQQAGFQVRRENINWNQAKLNRFPTLNASADYGINQGRSIDPATNAYINERVNYSSLGVSSNVVLFNGLSRQNAAKAGQLQYEASKKDWQQQKDDITINIIIAYLSVLNNEDLLEQSVKQSQLSLKQVERLNILDREGAIPPSQLSDLKGQYAGDQLGIINAREALEVSKIALCRLMNIPYDKQMKLERIDDASLLTRYEQEPGSIYEIALRQFSLVAATDLRERAAEKTLRSIKGQLFPSLSFNADVYSNYSSAARNPVFLNTVDVPSTDYVLVNGSPSNVIYSEKKYRFEKIGFGRQLNNNLYSSFSLSLRIPIFNALENRNRVKLARIDLEESRFQNKATKTQLQQAIEEAYINMTSSSGKYKILLEQVAAYAESFRAAEIRFNAGAGTPVDYLVAKNNLDRASLALIVARYDYIFRTKILDYYQGKQLW